MRIGRVILGAAQAAGAVVYQNRWRSLLTLTICGLGTAGVIVAGAVGQAHLQEMQQRLHALGGRMVVVSPNKVPPYPGRIRQLDHFISLEPEDAVSIAQQVPQVREVVPVVARNSTLRVGRNASRVRLLGTTPAYSQVREFALAKGRFLKDLDDGERVILLGHAISRELDPHGVRPGEVVMLGGHPYEVAGVLRPLGVNFAGEDEDHQAFIPLETYRQRIASRWWLHHLYLQLGPDADAEAVVKRVHRLVRERHNRRTDQVDDIIVRDVADVATTESNLLETALWVVSVTSALLLVMGIVGITTLMLQVVRQRRAEIGLRRALGATPFDVALQFFLEGMGLAAVGTVSGLLIGVVGTLAARQIISQAVTFPERLVLVAAALSLGMTGLASLIPAIIAARLEPARALRS